MCKGSGRHKLCLVTERASELLPADLSLIWKNRSEETASLLILFVPIQMLQFSARLSAEPWERAPPSSMCRGIAALLICISLWLQRERETRSSTSCTRSQNEPILSQIHLLAPISTLLERLHGTLPSRGEVAALSCCHFGNVVLQIGLAVVWAK